MSAATCYFVAALLAVVLVAGVFLHLIFTPSGRESDMEEQRYTGGNAALNSAKFEKSCVALGTSLLCQRLGITPPEVRALPAKELEVHLENLRCDLAEVTS